MRILFTNDDGIESTGLHALVDAFRSSGHELSVVAPQTEQSGASAAIGDFHIDQEIRYTKAAIPTLEGIPAIAVDGPPALCVWSACHGAYGPPPQLVVSGINAGANCGQAVLHSGTVGAALTAATFGLSGLAVSIVHSRRREIQWQTAGLLARGAAEWLIEAEPGSVLNLNVPNRQIGELEGVLGAPLSKIGTVQSSLFDEGNGRVRVQQERAVPEPGSDSAIVLDGKAALTLLSPICGHPTEMAASCVSEVLLQKRSPLARA